MATPEYRALQSKNEARDRTERWRRRLALVGYLIPIVVAVGAMYYMGFITQTRLETAGAATAEAGAAAAEAAHKHGAAAASAAQKVGAEGLKQAKEYFDAKT